MIRKLLYIVIFIVESISVNAQQVLIDEDFSNSMGKTAPGGWSNQLLSGNLSVDSFQFTDSLYILPNPIDSRRALFDSYNTGAQGGSFRDGLKEEVALVSPQVSSSGLSNLRLEFDLYLWSQAGPNRPSVAVDVSTNNGGNWQNVWSSNKSTNSTLFINLNLDSYINKNTLNIRFRWINNLDTNNFGYAAFDNILLLERDSIDVLIEPDFHELTTCTDSLSEVLITISNRGLNTATDIPLNALFSGALNTSLSLTLDSLKSLQTKVVSLGSINTIHSSAINAIYFSDHTMDGNRLNDSFKFNFIPPDTISRPVAHSNWRCGTGAIDLSANADQYHKLWFGDSDGNQPLDTGDIYKTDSLTSSRLFYVANVSYAPQEISTYQGQFRFSGSQTGGSYFDITAKSPLIIDSLSQLFSQASTNTTLKVYMIHGSSEGQESVDSLWTLVTSMVINTPGWGKYLRFDIPDIYLEKDSTYGFYVAIDGNTSHTFKSYALNVANNDLSLHAKRVNNTEFSQPFSLSNPAAFDFSWDGKVHYKKWCKSKLIPVEATIIYRPVGSRFFAGNNFNGSFENGTNIKPDHIPAGFRSSYIVSRPFKYSWSNYAIDFILDANLYDDNGNNLNQYLNTSIGTSFATLFLDIPTSLLDKSLKLCVTITDLVTGCDTSFCRLIKVSPKPKIFLNYNKTCIGDSTKFLNLSQINSGTINYKWYFGDGDSSELKEPTHRYKSAGKYTVRLIATSNFNIASDSVFQIEIFALPNVNYTVKNACEGKSLTFLNASNKIAGVSFEWFFGDGQKSTAIHVNHIYANSGSYITKLKASLNGCSDSILKSAFQFETPSASFTSAGYCSDADILFNNTSSISNNSKLAANWSFGDGSAFSNVKSPKHKYLKSGNYQVQLITSSEFNCKDTASATIVIVESPKADFSFKNACDQSPTQFLNETTKANGTSNQFSWMFESSTSLQENPQFSFTKSGFHKVQLNVNNSNGCVDSIEKQVFISSQPLAAFNIQDSCAGGPITFLNQSTNIIGIVNFKWYFGDGDSSIDVAPSHTYTNTVPSKYMVELQALAGNGCSSIYQREITVKPQPDCSFSYERSSTDRQEFSFEPVDKNQTSYQWLFANQASSTLIDPTYKFPAPDQNYKVKLSITSNNGCSCADSVELFAGWGALVNNISKSPFVVYPNPAKDKFYIDFKEIVVKHVYISMYDGHGKELLSKLIDASSIDYYAIDAVDLADGAYRLQIQFGNQSFSQNVIIAR